MEENKNIEPEPPPENIPEVDRSEIPPASEEIISSQENILPEASIITASKTEDMEVHHHTHPVHHKKKLTDYFWEFLMLFLAVFCGFLAEYQLEHKIEKDREIQFIKSLSADLMDDVNTLDTMLIWEDGGIARLDTLINLLDYPLLAKQNGDQLYYVARMGPRADPFANNSRTFDQLRNSGGFRLISNLEASNKIMSYYNQFSKIRLLEDNYNHEFDNYKQVAAKIFDPGVLRNQEDNKGEILRSNNNPQLRTYDAELLKELGFHTLQMNGSRRSKILLLKNMKKTAKDLMSYLKNKYHLN